MKECFFILNWSLVHALTIMKIKTVHRSNSRIGNLYVIDRLKSIDFRGRPHLRKKGNRLRFLSLNIHGFLFLNRGYHTIETTVHSNMGQISTVEKSGSSSFGQRSNQTDHVQSKWRTFSHECLSEQSIMTGRVPTH